MSIIKHTQADQISVVISCSLSVLGGNTSHILSLCYLFSHHDIQVTLASRSNDAIRFYRDMLFGWNIKLVTTPFNYSSSIIIKNLWSAIFWFRNPLQPRFKRFIAIGPGGFHRLLLRRCLASDGLSMYWEAGDGLYTQAPFQKKMLDSMNRIAANSRPVAEKISGYLHRQVDVLPPLNFIKNIEHRSQNTTTESKNNQSITSNQMPLQISCFSARSNSKESEESGLIRIVYLGRIHSLKGIETLIDIWPLLQIGNARLDLYGDGYEEHDLVKKVAQKGLTEFITFHGSYDREKDLENIMSQADMVVLPSFSEGFPHVLIESLAYGIPFVATNVGGIAELADNNPDVIIVEPEESAIVLGIRKMVLKIRNGEISSERLKNLYRMKYCPEVAGPRWIAYIQSDLGYSNDYGY